MALFHLEQGIADLDTATCLQFGAGSSQVRSAALGFARMQRARWLGKMAWIFCHGQPRAPAKLMCVARIAQG